VTSAAPPRGRDQPQRRSTQTRRTSGRNTSSTISTSTLSGKSLAPARIPHAGTTNRIVQQLSGSFGTAVLPAILQRGHGSTAFSHTFLWTIAFTVRAVGVALTLPTPKRETAERREPAQVAGPERPS
jgi:hypothetical protein